MSHLKITHLKNGTVVYDSADDEAQFFGGGSGNFGITFRGGTLPTMPPSPCKVFDRMTDAELEHWYERRHGSVNGEGDEHDTYEHDEPSDEEAS